MQPQVIINADDFGYSDGVNAGIKKAYEEGILTSTTALANGPAIENPLQNITNASSLSKPPLGIGVHLTLTYGEPLLPSLWNFPMFVRPFKDNQQKAWVGSAWKEYFSQFTEEQVEKEYTSQIEKVKEIFGQIDHIDSHHGSASYPPADKAYALVAKKYHLATRPLSPFSENSVYGGDFIVDNMSVHVFRKMGLKTVDSANMDYWHNKENPIQAFLSDLQTIKNNEVREYMFHPAADASMGAWRMKDLEILISKDVVAFIKTQGIQLTTYAHAAK